LTRVQHQLGEISLVRWQGRRNRRTRSDVSAWTLLLAACAVVGVPMLLAQGLGALPLTGTSALAPGALVLFALFAQIVIVLRAIIAWLGR
jgi:hypothetical protein